MDTELLKDDEVLREQGMISGPANCGRFELRTTSVTEVSWMQRNRVMEPGMDIIWRTCAFALIHTVPKNILRGFVNNPDKFIEQVDSWMDKNDPTSDEIKALAVLMNDRVSEWFASSNESGESGESGNP